MSTGRIIIILLTLTAFSACERASAPDRSEVIDPIRDTYAELLFKISAPGIMPTMESTFQGMAQAQASVAQQQSQLRAHLRDCFQKAQVKSVQFGDAAKADLKAPGSNDTYWPVQITLTVPEDKQSTECVGTFLMYRDDFKKWKAKPSSVNIGGNQLPKEKLEGF